MANQKHEGKSEMRRIAEAVHRGNVDADGMSVDLVPFDEAEYYPWERQPGEPNIWYQRFFLYYIPQGSRRAITEAYHRWRLAEKEERTFVSAPPNWDTKAYEWRWKLRAEAYDEYIRLEEQEKWERRQRALREREWAVSSSMLDVAQTMLENVQGKTSKDEAAAPQAQKTQVTSGRVPKTPRPQQRPLLKGSDISRFAEVGSKVGRLAAGMSTDQRTTVNIEAKMEDVRKRRWDDVNPRLDKILGEEVVEGEYEVLDEAVEPPEDADDSSTNSGSGPEPGSQEES